MSAWLCSLGVDDLDWDLSRERPARWNGRPRSVIYFLSRRQCHFDKVGAGSGERDRGRPEHPPTVLTMRLCFAQLWELESSNELFFGVLRAAPTGGSRNVDRVSDPDHRRGVEFGAP